MDDDSSPLAQEDDELLANVLALLTDRADPDGTAGQPMGVAHSPPLSHNGHAWVAAGDPLAIIDMFPDRAGPRPASTAIVSPSTETESAGGQTGQAWEGKGRRPRSYDSNKARNERKREIDVLRKEITELSYELTALQRLSIKDKDGVPSSQAIGHPRDAGSGHGAPRLWEAICRHQLERRISSERENSRLKRVLDDQTKMASSMQNLFKKQARSLDAEAANLQATKRVYSLPSDSDEDSTIFTRLLAEADAALFEVDGVFQLNGLSFSREPCRGAHMRDGERGRFVDLYSSSIFPFPLEPTANVVWQFYSGPDKHRGPLYYKTAKMWEASANTIIEKFAIELFAKGTRADFRVFQVVRRYVEADRVLVVWMSLTEPVEFANKPFSNCGFREKGYVVCKQADLAGVANPANFTHVLQCYRIVPFTRHPNNAVLSEEDKREIGSVIEFALGQDLLTSYLERFEDMLLHQTLGGR